MGKMQTLWAVEIDRMSPQERVQSTRFHPFGVTRDGALRLPLEAIPIDTRDSQWPIGEAPGWDRRGAGNTKGQWLALGSEFYFDRKTHQNEKLLCCIPSTWPPEAKDVVRKNLHSLVRKGHAIPFCGRILILPDPESFPMNTFTFEFADMESMSIFVGYRGQSKGYPEAITPGLYRRNNRRHLGYWMSKSRVCGNILKQRFVENTNKVLTDLEAVGVMQHYGLLGPTDLLDLTFKADIAKWFALNERVNGSYSPKKFALVDNEAEAYVDACRVYTVAIRLIDHLPLEADEARQLTSGIRMDWWSDLVGSKGKPSVEAPPANLAPLWSEYPKRQSGFGLRGVLEHDTDTNGSVLSIVEHVFHPTWFPDGWSDIGGPDIDIDGKQFSYYEDSSSLKEYLFPTPPHWFDRTAMEIKRLLHYE